MSHYSVDSWSAVVSRHSRHLPYDTCTSDIPRQPRPYTAQLPIIPPCQTYDTAMAVPPTHSLCPATNCSSNDDTQLAATHAAHACNSWRRRRHRCKYISDNFHWRSLRILPRHAMASAVYAMVMWPSVRLSQTGLISKRLNVYYNNNR